MINHARVVDDADREVGPGGTGELLLRNPVLTRGYYGMPDETARAFTGDGWLRTGDLVTADPAGQFDRPGGFVPDHPQDGFFSS